jgi:iron-sulfur cluster repair protein YtfE (RIC family)
MTWRDGPLQSWFDVHEDIRHELTEIRTLAAGVRGDDPDAQRMLTDRVQFFMDVLAVHSQHEDGIIFPFMRWRGLDVADHYTTEHHDEAAQIYDIRVALIAIRFREAHQEIGAALDEVRSGLAALDSALDAHLSAEEDDLIPQCENLPVDEQVDLVTRMVSQTPEWIAPHLTPWMVRMVSLDHQVHLLDAWSKTLAPEAFAAKAQAIRADMPQADWQALRDRVPALAAI